jgi:hypothetical protein
MAYESGNSDSPVASATYTINLPVPAAAPVFSPKAGTYTSPQSVSMATTTPGASIRYTTNGSTPTETNGTLYSGPVSIGSTATLKAIAYGSGLTDSSVSSATYTIASGAIPVEINDTAAGIVYTGTWGYSANRGLGDYQDNVHYTMTTGDSMSFMFAGTGITYVTEKNADEGNVDVYLDGVFQTTVSCVSSTRLAQQAVYSNTGLAAGLHILKLVKSSGTYMLVDALIYYQ